MISKETLVLSLSAAISGTVESAFKKVSSFRQEINKKFEKVNSTSDQSAIKGQVNKAMQINQEGISCFLTDKAVNSIKR